jgi:hypothetical protein
MASLSSLVYCLQVTPEAYLSEEPFRCSTLGQATDLTHKHETLQEKLAKDKH